MNSVIYYLYGNQIELSGDCTETCGIIFRLKNLSLNEFTWIGIAKNTFIIFTGQSVVNAQENCKNEEFNVYLSIFPLKLPVLALFARP